MRGNKCKTCKYTFNFAGNLSTPKREKNIKIASSANINSLKMPSEGSFEYTWVFCTVAQWGKSNKCNQCDYGTFEASDLRTHVKSPVYKRQTNATNATMNHFKQAI